jgi:ubiquinol-cytochrome c reductase cytochrome c1 subunit
MLRTSLHPVVVALIVGLSALPAIGADSTGMPQTSNPAASEPPNSLAQTAQPRIDAAQKTNAAKAADNSHPQASVMSAPTTPKASSSISATGYTNIPSKAVPAATKAAAAPSEAKPSDPNAHEEPKVMNWPFNGPTGYVDKQAAQRGFQVYQQICSACHSMNLVTYRSLSALGFSAAEIKAAAAQKQVEDFDDKGQRIDRPGKPFDHLVPPYPNEAASRAANGGAYPPDLSLIVKAREDGPNYVYSLITGFRPAPANEEPVANKYYNPYFIGHWISMPPPLHDDAITFQDGTPATVDQMAHDVVIYLQWAAEPEMEQRHRMGIKVMFFLFVMTGFLYVAKKRMWQKLKGK